jgi:hypothetical protein
MGIIKIQKFKRVNSEKASTPKSPKGDLKNNEIDFFVEDLTIAF